MLFDFPTNNIVHDIILNFFLLLCEQEEDVLMDIFVNTDLLQKIGSIWQKFTNNHEINCNKLYAWPKVKNDEGKDTFWCFFGHVAILTNMIIESVEEKPSLNELIEISEEWKQYTEPYLDEYNLLMVESTTC